MHVTDFHGSARREAATRNRRSIALSDNDFKPSQPAFVEHCAVRTPRAMGSLRFCSRCLPMLLPTPDTDTAAQIFETRSAGVQLLLHQRP